MPVEDVAEDVVTGRSDSEDSILPGNFQETVIDAGVFPGESVDVVVAELGMLGVELIVVDTPWVVLVK